MQYDMYGEEDKIYSMLWNDEHVSFHPALNFYLNTADRSMTEESLIGSMTEKDLLTISQQLYWQNDDR